jgi:methyl-accepting chemotaxis protein
MSELTIKARIALSFAAVLLMVAILTAISMSRVNTIDDSLARIQASNDIADKSEQALERTAAEVAKAREAASDFQTLMLSLCAATLVLGTALAAVIANRLLHSLGAEPAQLKRIAEAVGRGELFHDVARRTGDEYSIMATLAKMNATLRTTVADVREATQGVALTSHEIAQDNQTLSGRTEQQAQALGKTSASMDQLGSTVKRNADNAVQANELARGASIVAVKGGEVVRRVVDTMKGINDSSRKIADIIGVIDSIAFQTNILALNAAVEAARAGEQGRGFVVVAGEVRSLAKRSADAAKQIKALISASVERVDQGTQLVDQAGATMAEVVTSIKRVTEIMSAISAASAEQHNGVSQVSSAVHQMDSATRESADLVRKSTAAAKELSLQALQLDNALALFRLAQTEARSAPMIELTAEPTEAADEASTWSGAERRGPNRARNVVRPSFGSNQRS